MANSAIRIPIPGSIIDAVGADSGDLLVFDATAGQGGTFVNFKPLIQDLRPFTANSMLDFYVSIKSRSETAIWSDATKRGMTLAAALESGQSGLPVVDDIRLGINLSAGRPSHNLEVVGDMKVWGRELEAGEVVGRLKFFRGEDGEGGGTTEDANNIFNTPLANSTDAELNALQSSLRTGRLLVRDPSTKDTYFARLEDILEPGTGIEVTGNTVSLAEFCEINCPTGFTIRMDTDETGGESEAFRVVESVVTGTTVVDFPLLRLVRGHQPVVDWVNGQFQLGTQDSQTYSNVKFGVGTGSRFLPDGMLIEDGAGQGADPDPRYARLFGPVATNPLDIILTGTAGDTGTAHYYDTSNSQEASEVDGTGRFGFLPGIESITGGYANPGSFVSGFLNKGKDGGGVKIKACDDNGDEFALFIENGELSYVTGATGGSGTALKARHFTIQEDTDDEGQNDQYQNILANDAPVFSVRAASGDTFIRGFMIMPFLPGIKSDVDGVPTIGGAATPPGENVYSTFVEATPNGDIVTMKRYTWTVPSSGVGAWVETANFTLPKGTLYSDASGNVKIARDGPNISNHGLNGVSSWKSSQ